MEEVFAGHEIQTREGVPGSARYMCRHLCGQHYVLGEL